MTAITSPRVAIKPDGGVTVKVTPEIMYSFEKLTALNKSILGRLGCPTCHSGLNIHYVLHEQEFSP